ncbi:unnamed protein product, partial [Amoebophrya sp. A120]
VTLSNFTKDYLQRKYLTSVPIEECQSTLPQALEIAKHRKALVKQLDQLLKKGKSTMFDLVKVLA